MDPGGAISLAAALVVLVGIAAGLGVRLGAGQPQAVVTATVRAAIQLVAVGAVIAVVIRTPTLAPLYLAVMVGAASWTSGRRIGGGSAALIAAGTAIVAGAGISAAVVFATRALMFGAGTAVPFIAQLVGGSMTATTLSGQRLRDDAQSHWSEVEAWLSLGASERQALADLARTAGARALVPALDQTRNVGLVVLPGAFVGLLLGGASPLQAGRVQLLVLVGLLTAESIAALTVTGLLSARLELVQQGTAPPRRRWPVARG